MIPAGTVERGERKRTVHEAICSIRRQFISMALADPVDDGGTPLALKRFKRSVPLHKRARAIVADIFKEGTHG
jgi:hypothetical protein